MHLRGHVDKRRDVIHEVEGFGNWLGFTLVIIDAANGGVYPAVTNRATVGHGVVGDGRGEKCVAVCWRM